MITLSVWLDTPNTAIPNGRSALIGGDLSVAIDLGLSTPAAHIERAERDCLALAGDSLALHLGPAARVIECGPFAGLALQHLLSALERPKAGIIMTSGSDPRQNGRRRKTLSTAQITHIHHDASDPSWPLDAVGAGKTLIFVGGGGFGLTPPHRAFALLENAAHTLNIGDFVGLTLETPRDGAVIDATYADYGKHIVGAALASLGRAEAIESRTFYDPITQRVRFGGVALSEASIAWNGTRCSFNEGTWIDVGAMTLHSASAMLDLHPDFDIHDQWQSHDKVVTLLLLRKI